MFTLIATSMSSSSMSLMIMITAPSALTVLTAPALTSDCLHNDRMRRAYEPQQPDTAPRHRAQHSRSHQWTFCDLKT